MSEIKIKDKIALVDEEDFKRINYYKWFLDKNGYAVANLNYKQIKMHHLVIGKPPEKVDLHVTDHINSNKLDNRKSNLRHVSNRFNTKRAFFHTKGYYQRKDTGKWQVNCKWPGIERGCFNTEEEAVKRVAKIRELIEELNG